MYLNQMPYNDFLMQKYNARAKFELWRWIRNLVWKSTLNSTHARGISVLAWGSVNKGRFILSSRIRGSKKSLLGLKKLIKLLICLLDLDVNVNGLDSILWFFNVNPILLYPDPIVNILGPMVGLILGNGVQWSNELPNRNVQKIFYFIQEEKLVSQNQYSSLRPHGQYIVLEISLQICGIRYHIISVCFGTKPL